MKKLTQTEIAWVAGFLEGDGCFRCYNYQKSIQASQAEPRIDLLKKLQEYFGGKIYEDPRKKKTHKRIFSWRLFGKENIIYVIQLILPFMISKDKKEKAQKLLNSCLEPKKWRGKIKPSKNELKYLYWNKDMTQREIASYLGRGKSSIHKWMKEYNIPTRNKK